MQEAVAKVLNKCFISLTFAAELMLGAPIACILA